MQPLTQADITFIKTVSAHLKQVSILAVFNVDEATLRVASSSLRLLLVDDALGKAWKTSRIGGAMTFKAWCITATQDKDVVAYCGGGDILPGIPVSVCRNAILRELALNLVDFRRRPRIQIGDIEVSTVQLVQYVANTLGGIHFDPKSTKKPWFNLLRRLEAGEFNVQPALVNGRNLLHHELLSIAQVVIRSREVVQLRAWSDSLTVQVA